MKSTPRMTIHSRLEARGETSTAKALKRQRRRRTTASHGRRAAWDEAAICALFCLLVATLSRCAAGRAPQEEDFAVAAEDAARAGNFREAAEAYQKALERDPRSPQLWSNLGTVRVLAGDCAGGLPALEKARNLDSRLFSPWYFAGFCHLQFHQDPEAVKELRHATTLNPKDPNAWYLLAKAAGDVGDLGTALQSSLRSLALDNQRSGSYYLAGRSALDMATAAYARIPSRPGAAAFVNRLEGERDSDQGVWPLATHAFQAASTAAPETADIHFLLGQAEFASGNLEAAEAPLRKCAQLAPGAPWPALRLALVLAREGKTAEARRLVEGIPPQRLQAREEFLDFLACACLLGLSAPARQALEGWRARFPKDAELEAWQARVAALSTPAGNDPSTSIEPPKIVQVALSVRFQIIANRANLVEALFATPAQYREFRSAFLRDDWLTVGKLLAPRAERLPNDAASAFALGELLHWLSYRYYDELGTRFPDSLEAQMLAAENYSAAGQQDKALAVYQALREKAGPSPDLLRAIAQIYWTQHRWDEALKVLQDLAAMDPRDPAVFVNMARIYSYRHDLEHAAVYFQRAAKLDGQMFEAHLGMGETLHRKGADEEALRELLLASRIDPENPRPHYELSQVYRKLEKKDLAQKEMATFQRLQAVAGAQKTAREQQLVPLE